MTSTGVLCTHLIKFHAAEYLEACQMNGGQPKVMVKELNSTTSGDLDELPHLPFMKARFQKALVEWIVGFDEYFEHFSALIIEMKASEGKLSLTVDGWDNKTPIQDIPKELAKALLQVTDLAHVTDSTSNMSAMMEDYEYLLKDCNISFDAANSHIICFPHTLHLAVTAMLDAVTSPTARSNVTAPFTSPYEEPFAIDQ
ncbi:hypothetical protein M422DRAFT_239252 [Sphaerobolus stellatus SS14]|nr:hypothetical protein M422DRAFT_239252 [Sphaerobolus stellatus SS14]